MRELTRMPKTRVACGTGYLGGRTDSNLVIAAARLADVVVMEALAEATLGTFALARRTGRAFSTRFFDRMAPSIASLVDSGIHVVSSAGICDPAGAAEYLADLLAGYGVHPRIAAITGDELTGYQPATGPREGDHLGSFAYLGGRQLHEAVDGGEYDIVLTGRATDPALYVLPLLDRYPDVDHDVIAHWVVAGHLAECGAHVTGGNYNGPGWEALDFTRIGNSIVVANDEPSFEIRPLSLLDGFVNAATVSQQLLYETTDPSELLSPDAVVDFSDIHLQETEAGVVVRNVRGRPPTGLSRVLSYFQRGEIVELEVAYGWPDAERKARRAADVIAERCARIVGPDMPEPDISVFGVDGLLGDTPSGLTRAETEVKARIAYRVIDPDVAAIIVEEAGALYDCGPAGACDIAGPTVGNPASSRAWIDIVEEFIPSCQIELSVSDLSIGRA
jgi:hypothetical protein